MALFRPSELARFWGVHGKTVNQWIREGRLPAIKTPGAQYRIRSEEARAFCEAMSLPMPRALAHPLGSVTSLGKASPTQRALGKACRARGTSFTPWTAWLDGLLASVAEPPDAITVDAGCPDLKLSDLVRAVRRTPSVAAVPIVVYDVPLKAPKPLGVTASDDVRLAPKSHPAEAVRELLDLLERRRPI